VVTELKTDEIVSLIKWMESPTCIEIFLKEMGNREVGLLESLLQTNSDETRGRIKEIRHFVVLHDQLRDELEARMKSPKPSDLDGEEKLLRK